MDGAVRPTLTLSGVFLWYVEDERRYVRVGMGLAWLGMSLGLVDFIDTCHHTAICGRLVVGTAHCIFLHKNDTVLAHWG